MKEKSRHWPIEVGDLNNRCFDRLTGFWLAFTCSSTILVRHAASGTGQPAYNSRRPGGGRLFNAPYLRCFSAGVANHIGKAQLLLLKMPESEARLQAQGLIYLAHGDWEKFTALYTGCQIDKGLTLQL